MKKMSLLILLTCFLVGCAHTNKMSNYERAIRAEYYRTQNEREYIRLYDSCHAIAARCDSLERALDHTSRIMLILTDSL
jgi:hypothetical protein